jgi:hypothetical protein
MAEGEGDALRPNSQAHMFNGKSHEGDGQAQNHMKAMFEKNEVTKHNLPPLTSVYTPKGHTPEGEGDVFSQ